MFAGQLNTSRSACKYALTTLSIAKSPRQYVKKLVHTVHLAR